jgi:formamidopyrimidine-DNA glycosylase
MPEMPEVQTIINDLKKAGIIGCTITETQVFWAKTVADMDPESFAKELQNQTILDLQRRAKYMIFSLSSGKYLCVHLRMTGRLLLNDGHDESPYIRLRLKLEGHKSLDYYDTRKFGRWYLVDDLDSVVGHIGPEPLEDFSGSQLYSMLNSHSRALKPLLLDQSFLAGLGNIYVDEALWESHLHPLSLSNTVTKKQADLLYQSICKVLKRGIDSQGTTLGTGKTNYYRLDGTRGNHQTQLMVFRRTSLPCFRCGDIICRIVVAQRSTHICPTCQIKR